MLYTGKGDKGTTKLFNTPSGERLPKTHPVFEALGTVDELVALLGLLKVRAAATDVFTVGERPDAIIHRVQETLFVLQAELAGAGMSITDDRAVELGAIVDAIEKELPPITSFFIAGGTEAAAQADVCRAVARRMERTLLRATESGIVITPGSLAYANRLSSLLYAFARYFNHTAGIGDVPPTYNK